jgi:hypothetical protein
VDGRDPDGISGDTRNKSVVLFRQETGVDGVAMVRTGTATGWLARNVVSLNLEAIDLCL